MAGIESIQEAERVFEERISDLVLIVQTIESAVSNADSGVPHWHQLFFSRIIDIQRAFEAHVDAVQVHAYPVLKDMRAMTR